MAEALACLKREFGRSAIILTTRTFTRGGFLGIGGKPCVEITAAREMHDVPPEIRRTAVRMKAAHPEDSKHRKRAVPAKPAENGRWAGGVIPQLAAPVAEVVPPGGGPRVFVPEIPEQVLSEVGSLKTLVGDLVKETRRLHSPHLPSDLHDSYQSLVGNAVAEELAASLVERVRAELPLRLLKDSKAVRAALAELITPSIPAAGPITVPSGARPYIVALIGPTGVGKTTTVAKLAANFCLRDKRKVGLITLDTYRIAAVEQLRTYAQIIDVPLEVAASADQLREAVERLSGCDVILIDTAGRSQRDAGKIRQLAAYFTAVRPHETHLVLSSTAGQKVLDETIDRFKPIGIDRVIFTKLDEALGFGVILNCVQKAEAKLSYVTTGQDVPSDIEIAQPRVLAELILGTADIHTATDAGTRFESVLS